MKLSVIMTTYNNQDTIQQVIESILNQTFSDFEFIIVNDGSTDKTQEIIRSYQKRDKRIGLINQENLGVTKSLNKALMMAKGEYVARQDADDISLPRRFKEQVRFLEDNNDIGFTGCSFEIIDKNGKFLNFVYIKNNPKKIRSRLIIYNIFCHGSTIFRRDILEKAGGYREFFKYSQDYDLYLRMIELSMPGAVEEILYQRRELLENISIQKFSLQIAYADLARKCYESRMAKSSDSFLLNEQSLRVSPADYALFYMKSFYCVKGNNIAEARMILRNYMLPVNKEKVKFYLLWCFSYLPAFVRNLFFSTVAARRKIKMQRCLRGR